MPTEIKMPQLGESVHEGTITRWLKQPGETVNAYEPLLEVTTDKITSEVTAPVGGILSRILAPEGATVKIDTIIALIEPAGAVAVAPPPSAAPPPAAPLPSARPDTVRPPSPLALRVAQEHGIDPTSLRGSGPGGQVTKEDVLRAAQDQRPPAVDRPPSAGSAPVALAPSEARSLSSFLSPRVQLLASQLGVDLAQVQGTGRDGRITARDVEAYAARQTSAELVRPPSPTVANTPAARPDADDELVPLSPMRRAIAEHMVLSKRTAPHVTTVHEADVTRLVQFYQRHRDAFRRREGFALTYTPFFVLAAVAALRAFPGVNATFTNEGILHRRAIHIGVAVALADGGLVVLVIRHADEKTLVRLAREVADVAGRARSGSLTPDENRGGTFTITNHGVFGSLLATPVIHQPQAAILGIGAIQKRVVVREGDEGDTLAVRSMVYLSLSFDHRALDGAAADAFMRHLVSELEQGQWTL